jgi:hypothetical protein
MKLDNSWGMTGESFLLMWQGRVLNYEELLVWQGCVLNYEELLVTLVKMVLQNQYLMMRNVNG